MQSELRIELPAAPPEQRASKASNELRQFLSHPVVQVVSTRTAAILATLLVIVYLAAFGLTMAARGRAGLPAEPTSAALQALEQTAAYVAAHPSTYFVQRANKPALQVVAAAFINSASLLLVALGLAALLGVPLGVLAAISRRAWASTLILIVSIIGISIPSFLLAMVLWIVNTQIHNRLGVPALPPTGFGWDAHLIMPALVLAARPFAQVVQITHVSLSEALKQDYVRTAQSKGLRDSVVVLRHALRNALAPILNTLGASLRFSLASLPVVELFFVWPGVGLLLLQAIERGMDFLVIDLVVALGAFFLIVNLLLELLAVRLDPRLKEALSSRSQREDTPVSWRQRIAAFGEQLSNWMQKRSRIGKTSTVRKLPPLPAPASAPLKPEVATSRKARNLLSMVFGNLPLVLGGILVLALVAMVLFGSNWTTANPYKTHTVMTIEGKTSGPPFAPSSVFPWGSDPVGRDIQALVLWGARQTLGLAFVAMIARLLLGGILGTLAGWQRGGWLDRAVQAAIVVMAAFPVTLFTMILILGLGIQQGTWVFVVALCVVGWGEIAQFLRGQVSSLTRVPFVEAAHAAGAHSRRILSRHILPQLVGSILVLASLEMGAVLMLLAELGFLNVFLGGGFRVEIGESGRMQPVIYYFSDVPEWGALLANIRNWWRSYGWLAWYAGACFFLAILAFNLLGEGLRRFLEESRVNLSRAFTRFSVGAACLGALGLFAFTASSSPLEVYKPIAQSFSAVNAMQDIRALASEEYGGRETGTPGAKLAAEYIARRMAEIGLQPAGEKETYLRAAPTPRYHLAEVPRLVIPGDRELEYRRDFVEYARGRTFGEFSAPVVGLALGHAPEGALTDPYKLSPLGARNRIFIVREEALPRLTLPQLGGALIVTRDPSQFERRFLTPSSANAPARTVLRNVPAMYITPDVAEELLASAGSSLAELDHAEQNLTAGEAYLTGDGRPVEMRITSTLAEGLEEKYYDVIGFIPGSGSDVSSSDGASLDSHVILVSAYYDGLGVGPDGTLYPGANDNASGVAAMLELARALKASPYKPDKTVVFVAWSGGERGDGLSVFNIMNTKTGFHRLLVETIVELSGVAAGSGDAIQLNQGTSFRLVQLMQAAGEKLGVAVTTRGRGPHFGLPASFGVGGRSALTASVSWDGSDQTTHTPRDTPESLDPTKLDKLGRTLLLFLTVLTRETEY